MQTEFFAMAQGVHDYSVPVIRTNTDEFGDMLTLMTEYAAFYVTKEQAMTFFNLVEIPIATPKECFACMQVNKFYDSFINFGVCVLIAVVMFVVCYIDMEPA